MSELVLKNDMSLIDMVSDVDCAQFTPIKMSVLDDIDLTLG